MFIKDVYIILSEYISIQLLASACRARNAQGCSSAQRFFYLSATMEHDLPRHLFFSLINAPSRKKVKKIINARNNSYRAYGTPINNLMLLFIMR